MDSERRRTSKQIQGNLKISHVALNKALKNIPYTLINVEGSTKKVKAYRDEDLPLRFKGSEVETPLANMCVTEVLLPNAASEIAPISTFCPKYLLASAKKQSDARLRVKLVEFYLARKENSNVQSWLKQLFENTLEFDSLGDVSPKTLYDWLSKYKEARTKGLDLVGHLVDERGKNKADTTMTKQMQDMAVLYFLKTHKVKLANIHLNMCSYFGDEMVSYKVLNKFYKDWVRKNPVAALFAQNPDKAKSKYLMAIGDMSEKATYRNAYWELDSTPADVICADGKRYNILSAIDIYSRRVVSIVEPTSNQFAISRLLRKAILILGIPENVVIDNGRDYTSQHFESICLNLGIKIHIVPPFSGDKKPHIERFFGTLSRSLFAELGGYIGASVAEKMAIKNKISWAEQQQSIDKWKLEKSNKSDEEKEAFSKLFLIKKENLGVKIDLCMPSFVLAKWVDAWTTNLYEQKLHKGIKTTPMQKWNDSTLPVQGIGDIRMLDLLLGKSIKRHVGKKAIFYNGGEYCDEKLVAYAGKDVMIMEQEDLGKLVVYDVDTMEFICEAVDLSLVGNRRELAVAVQKRQKKTFRAIDNAIKYAQNADLIDVTDRIKAAGETTLETSNALAVMKRTEVVEMLLRAKDDIKDSFAEHKAKTKDQTLKTNIEVFKSVGGRPMFKSFKDRFVWDLKNDMVDATTEALAIKHPEMWEIAKREVMAG